MSKLFSSNPVNNGAGTDILITQYTGPTARHSGQLANAAIHSAASSASVNGFQLRGFALGARDDMRDMPLLSVLLAARLGSEAS